MDIGFYLNRNDARVAEVWLDQYKQLFYRFRRLNKESLGDITSRQALRVENQCKSFEWYLTDVCRTVYVPDFTPAHFRISSLDNKLCLDNRNDINGQVSATFCREHNKYQEWTLTSNGFIQTSDFVNNLLVCMRWERITQSGCKDAVS